MFNKYKRMLRRSYRRIVSFLNPYKRCCVCGGWAFITETDFVKYQYFGDWVRGRICEDCYEKYDYIEKDNK